MKPPAMQETWVRSLGQEDPPEEDITTYSSILAWKTPWTEKPGGLQFMGSQSIGHNCVMNTHTHISPNKGAKITLLVEGRGNLNKSMEA